MTPEEGSAESSGAQSGPTASAVRRPAGRGRYSRGRRRPRRSGNQPRRLPSDPPPESAAPEESDRAREGERTREPLSPPFQPAKIESIQAAIDKVTTVIGELRDVLNDMELVLEYLEDVERQQIADEREIEGLQQRLNSMHRRVERYPQQQRSSSAPRPAEESADEGD